MGRLVKLIGSGIGLAAEAIHSQRSPSPSGKGKERTTEDQPPPYVELPEERANELIAQGRAVPADQRDLKENHEVEEDEDDSDEEHDEADWDLDDAVGENTDLQSPPEYSEVDVDQIVRNFVNEHPMPSSASPTALLPCPVIIPQRRPRNKSRGFIRAYAPVLNDCGITRVVFMDFLKSFHQASNASISIS